MIKLTNSILAEQTEEKEKDSPDLSDKLLKTRTLIISAPVDSKLADRMIKQILLLEADDPKAEIKVLINSPGGSISDGFAIYDMLKMVDCPVSTLVMGLAASMGSVLSLVADEGKRYSLPNSKIMIHQPLIQQAQGDATNLEIHAKEILKTREWLAKLYSEKTGKDVEQIISDMDRDNWFTAEEALEYGLIDKIITTRKDF